jgi:hypothetical protein
MKKDLPIFDIVLDESNLKQGVGMISLVDDPAIGVNWIKLRNQLVDVEMSFTLTKDGICLGCPPTGDGTTKSGAKDKRCGDGVRKTSSKKPKAPKKEEVNSKVKDAVDKSGKLNSASEIDSALDYMKNSSSQTTVMVEPDVLKSYVDNIESNLPKDYTKTSEKLIGGGSGDEEYLKGRYGPDYKNKEIYKKDIVKTNALGSKILWKDAPFMKKGNTWVEVDTRDISGRGRYGHKDFSNPVFAANTATGKLFSYDASERIFPDKI